MKAEDFNLTLTNLLIDLYLQDYEKYFKELEFDEKDIDHLNKENLEKLTNIAAVFEYVGNRRSSAKVFQ
jgi:hypothetical protein